MKMADVIVKHFSIKPMPGKRAHINVVFTVSVTGREYDDSTPSHVWFLLHDPAISICSEASLGDECIRSGPVSQFQFSQGWMYAGIFTPGISARFSRIIKDLEEGLDAECMRIVAATRIVAGLNARQCEGNYARC